MKDDSNMPAFPFVNVENSYANEGMTLRDYFAAKAMQGFAAADEQYQDTQTMANHAYAWADAMLKARESK